MLSGVNKCFMFTSKEKVIVHQRLMTRQRQVKIIQPPSKTNILIRLIRARSSSH